VNVVGTSGSGKSTFSRELAAALSVRHVEMDAIHWLPDWHELNDEQFAAQLERALVADSWVLDGNYSRFNDLKWALTDTIIWLDYSLPRTFAQILARSVRRALTGVEIWPGTGNTETLYRNFCSRDSVILWMMTSYYSNRKRCQALLGSDLGSRIDIVRVSSPSQARKLIQRVSLEGG
jgi:adenylate kinase family enzyme